MRYISIFSAAMAFIFILASTAGVLVVWTPGGTPIDIDTVSHKHDEGRLIGWVEVDASLYASGWKDNMAGQRIFTSEAWIEFNHAPGQGQSCAKVKYVKYEVYTWRTVWTDAKGTDYFKSISGPWGEDNKVNAAGQDRTQMAYPNTFDSPSLTIELKGSWEGGVGIEYWVKIGWFNCLTGAESDSSWYLFARDEAFVRTGIGTVTWTKTQYVVGDVAELKYEIPYVEEDKEGTGWWLGIKSAAQGFIWVVDINTNKLTKTSGSEKYTVSEADFACTGGGIPDNELIGILRNEIWNKDFELTTTIDVAGAGPVVTSVSITPAVITVGDTATISYSASPSTETQGKIIGFHVVVTIGGGDIIHDNKTTATSVTIHSVPHAGTLVGQVIAYDEFCRPSEVNRIEAEVYDPGDTPPPGVNLPWVLIIGLVATILGLAAAFTLKQSPLSKWPKNYKIIMGIAIVFFVFIIINQAGYARPWLEPFMMALGLR